MTPENKKIDKYMKLVKISLKGCHKEGNKAVSLNFREMSKMTSYKKAERIQNQGLFLSLSFHFPFYIYIFIIFVHDTFA